jgi:hypothetical protein
MPQATIAYYFTSSGLLTLYNKWLWVSWGFKYPVLTTSVHLLVSGACGACCQFSRDGTVVGVSGGEGGMTNG